MEHAGTLTPSHVVTTTTTTTWFSIVHLAPLSMLDILSVSQTDVYVAVMYTTARYVCRGTSLVTSVVTLVNGVTCPEDRQLSQSVVCLFCSYVRLSVADYRESVDGLPAVFVLCISPPFTQQPTRPLSHRFHGNVVRDKTNRKPQRTLILQQTAPGSCNLLFVESN